MNWFKGLFRKNSQENKVAAKPAFSSSLGNNGKAKKADKPVVKEKKGAPAATPQAVRVFANDIALDNQSTASTGELPTPKFDIENDELAFHSVSPDQISPEAMSKTFNFDIFNLLVSVPDDVLLLAEPKFAVEKKFVPIERIGNTVKIIYADPSARRDIIFALNSTHPELEFDFQEMDPIDLEKNIDSIYAEFLRKNFDEQREQTRHALTQQVKKVELLDNSKKQKLVFSSSPKFKAIEESIRIMGEQFLVEAYQLNASDITIMLNIKYSKDGDTSRKEMLIVKCRIDGKYKTLYEEPLQLEKYRRLIQVLKILTGDIDIADIRNPKTGIIRPTIDTATSVNDVELRCNFMPTSVETGEHVCIRIQEKSNFSFTVRNLGMLPYQREIFKNNIQSLNSGVVLFSGPTGQGKNTSMVATLYDFQQSYPGKNFITVEDPPEFQLYKVTQITVDRENVDPEKRTFSYWLSHALRQDPDVLMVGEVRDDGSAKMVIDSAIVGHLTLSTIHAASSIQTILRLRDFGIASYKIAESLRAVVAQRLVGKMCTNCELIADPEIDKYLDAVPRLYEYCQLLGKPDHKFKIASGKVNGKQCNVCYGDGIVKRLGIFEILVVSKKIRDLIHDNASSDRIRIQANREGFRSLWSNGLEAVLNGDTTLGEVLGTIDPPQAELEGLKSLDDDESFSR